MKPNRSTPIQADPKCSKPKSLSAGGEQRMSCSTLRNSDPRYVFGGDAHAWAIDIPGDSPVPRVQIKVYESDEAMPQGSPSDSDAQAFGLEGR
jgi:hypothetical protein